jgi:hypothetical protein
MISRYDYGNIVNSYLEPMYSLLQYKTMRRGGQVLKVSEKFSTVT